MCHLKPMTPFFDDYLKPLMGFLHCLSIFFFPPVMPILPEISKHLPIKKKK